MRVPVALVALVAVVAVPAAAQDYPKLKAGQWETTIVSTRAKDAAPQKMTMCTDDSIQKQMLEMSKGMQKEMCSRSDFRREGGSYVGDSVCQMGSSKMTSHSVMTIQGDAGYKTVINTTYDPPFMGMKDSNTSVDGKYLGPCRDGLQPGDVMMPDGKKFNMKAMPGQAPAAPPAKAK